MTMFDDVASAYDQGMQPLERLVFRRLRQRMIPRVRGDVLELGTGTGINLPLYRPGAHVYACDASKEMLAKAARRRSRVPVRLVRADVQRLPFPTGCFDAATGSLVFCSVADPVRGLVEARRVLRPGGRLVLIEHTRGSGLGGWLTDMVQLLWRRWSRECHLNRETVLNVAKAGFTLQSVRQQALGIVQSIEAAK